jgi:hypothetical protein
MLPIAGLQVFYLVVRRTRIPILDNQLIRRAVNRQTQVVGLAGDHEIREGARLNQLLYRLLPAGLFSGELFHILFALNAWTLYTTRHGGLPFQFTPRRNAQTRSG